MHNVFTLNFFVMKFILTAAILLFSIITATAQPDLVTELDAIFAPLYPSDGPGCVVLIARKGEVLYRKAFGMANVELEVSMNPENVFRIASLTKQFTSVAILQLHEKGLLNIEDDIKKYIPDFPSTDKITIANLMSHTSGIKNITDTELAKELKRKSSAPAELVDKIKTLPAEFKPGTQHRYSNSGYLLLGYIIEKVSGQTYEQYISENIFKPLHMDRAYYDHAQTVVPGRAGGYVATSPQAFRNADFLDQSFPYAAGALMMSVDDMYKWHKGLCSYGIIKKETLEKAFTPFTLADGSKTSYGFGWALDRFLGGPMRLHGGAIDGFSAIVMYLPEKELFMVAFSNVDRSVAAPAMQSVATIVNKETPLPVLPAKATDRYIGTYQFPDGALVKIYKENGRFYLKDGRAPEPWQMYFTDDKNFYCRELLPNNHMFTIGKKGMVEAFTIQSGGQELKVRKIG